MPEYETDPHKFHLDLTCPKCRHLVRAIPEAGPVFPASQYSDEYVYLIGRCPRYVCDPMFIIYDRLNKCVHRVYPFPRCTTGDFHQAIPEKIRADWAEARTCIYADAPKGTLVLCRRVLQQIAVDKNAQGFRLIDQIDDLFENGLITKSLKDAAHEIRHLGNFGAHPRDDGLDEIRADDARAVIRLTEGFLVDLYVRPHETNALTKKRQPDQ